MGYLYLFYPPSQCYVTVLLVYDVGKFFPHIHVRCHGVESTVGDAENAGMENAGPNFARVDKAGPPSMEREMGKYKCIMYR